MATIIDAENRFLTFDNVLTESYREPATVTAHPVENTATVTDHRQVKQKEVDLQVLITETPLAKGGLTELDYGPAALDIPKANSTIEGPRAFRALAFVRRMANLGTFSYTSRRLGLIERLMMVDFDYTVRNRRDLVINMACVQVEFSESRTVDLPPLTVRRSKPEVCPTVEQGDRGKTDVSSTPPGSPVRRSIGNAIGGSLAGDDLENVGPEILDSFKLF